MFRCLETILVQWTVFRGLNLEQKFIISVYTDGSCVKDVLDCDLLRGTIRKATFIFSVNGRR